MGGECAEGEVVGEGEMGSMAQAALSVYQLGLQSPVPNS